MRKVQTQKKSSGRGWAAIHKQNLTKLHVFLRKILA